MCQFELSIFICIEQTHLKFRDEQFLFGLVDDTGSEHLTEVQKQEQMHGKHTSWDVYKTLYLVLY